MALRNDQIAVIRTTMSTYRVLADTTRRRATVARSSSASKAACYAISAIAAAVAASNSATTIRKAAAATARLPAPGCAALPALALALVGIATTRSTTISTIQGRRFLRAIGSLRNCYRYRRNSTTGRRR